MRRRLGPYNPTKWGAVPAFLRTSGEITPEEERGLAGAFGFPSPGANRPVGIAEDQMTRLGRSFALSSRSICAGSGVGRGLQAQPFFVPTAVATDPAKAMTFVALDRLRMDRPAH